MASSTSPSPASPEPQRGSAPATQRSGVAFALTSLLLSLAPLVALGCIRVIALAAAASTLPGYAITVLSVAVYAASFSGSLGAVLTGRLALRRAGQQSQQPAVRAMAIVGIVLGIAGMVLVVVGGAIVGQVLYSCSANPANCG